MSPGRGNRRNDILRGDNEVIALSFVDQDLIVPRFSEYEFILADILFLILCQ